MVWMTPVQGCRELRGCVVIAHCGSPCQELSHPRLFPAPSFPRVHGHISSFCVCAQSCDKLVTLVNFDEFSVWIRYPSRWIQKKKLSLDRAYFISRCYKYLSPSLPKCDLKCSFKSSLEALFDLKSYSIQNILVFWERYLPHDFSRCIRVYFESDLDGDSQEKYSVNMEQVNSIRDVAVWKLDGKIEYPRRTRTLYVDRKYFFETFEILIIVEFYYYFKNINSR